MVNREQAVIGKDKQAGWVGSRYRRQREDNREG